ncbi:MAG TPA: Uma2 family endonuclease [Gemmataceae bacterium]|jgi:Uma2 family endonuclease
MVVKTVEQAAGPITGRIVLFRMNSKQFAALPESEQNLQLLNGEVVLSPRPRLPHQLFIGRLFAVLDEWVQAHQLGAVYPEVEMQLDDKWTPAADLIFVAAEHVDRIGDNQILGPADLAVEVLSPSNVKDDRERKFKAYAEHGIGWYWIVDLEGRVLEEYQLVGTAYGNRVEIPFDRPFTPRIFPGLTIDLARLAQ